MQVAWSVEGSFCYRDSTRTVLKQRKGSSLFNCMWNPSNALKTRCVAIRRYWSVLFCVIRSTVCGRAGKQQRNSDLHSRKITHGLPFKTAAFVARPETPPPPRCRRRHDAESHVGKEGSFLSPEAPRFDKFEPHRSLYLFRRPSRIICSDEERDKIPKSRLKGLIRRRQ